VIIFIFIISILIIKNKKKNKKNLQEKDNLDDYSDLYGYSSKNRNAVSISNNNIQQDSIEDANNLEEKYIDEDELIPKMNQNLNESVEKISNEPKRMYVNQNMYEDYEEKNDSKPTYNNIPDENSDNTNQRLDKGDSYYDDYTIDDNYKFKKSKGKHSK